MQTLPYKKIIPAPSAVLCQQKGAGILENNLDLQYRNFIDLFNIIFFGVTSQKQR